MSKQPIFRKLTLSNYTVLLHTTAVRVVYSSTGRLTLVYEQHDIASQKTLNCERLKSDLDMANDKNWTITIQTLAQQISSSCKLRVFLSAAVH